VPTGQPAGFQLTPAPARHTTPPTETATTPAALTTSYVIERLDAEGFLFVRSDQSRRIYSRWIEERLSPERFERALQMRSKLWLTIASFMIYLHLMHCG
jgi:hypothetical protein